MNFFTKKTEPVPKDQWIIHEDKIPAIVSKGTWENANAILNSKKKKYNMEKTAGYFKGIYQLSTKIRCAKCGGKYYHDVYSTSSGKYGVWKCSSCKEPDKEKRCINSVIKESELDYIVKEVMFEMWEDKGKQIANVIKALEETIDEDSNDAELEKMMKAIAKLKHKKEKLFELYTEEIITKEEFKEKNKELNEQIRTKTVQYEEQKKESLLKGTKEIRMKRIKEFLNQDLKNVKSVTDTMMRELIHEIVVYPDRKIDITFNSNRFGNVSDTGSAGSSGGSGCRTIR